MLPADKLAARVFEMRLATVETAALVRASRELVAGSRRLIKRTEEGVKNVHSLMQRTQRLYELSRTLLGGEKRP